MTSPTHSTRRSGNPAVMPARFARSLPRVCGAIAFLWPALCRQQLAEEVHGPLDAVVQGHLRLPVEVGTRKSDVRAPAGGIVLGQRLEYDFRRRLRELQDLFGELHHRGLDRIAEVARAGEAIV